MQQNEKKNRFEEKSQNGNHFWNFMHTLAAYYPEKPSSDEREKMKFFVQNSAYYFLIEPKWIKRFHKHIEAMPPKLDSRDDFILWTCEQHNLVNESIGKQVFPCVLEGLKKRWGPVTLPESKPNTEKMA